MISFQTKTQTAKKKKKKKNALHIFIVHTQVDIVGMFVAPSTSGLELKAGEQDTMAATASVAAPSKDFCKVEIDKKKSHERSGVGHPRLLLIEEKTTCEGLQMWKT